MKRLISVILVLCVFVSMLSISSFSSSAKITSIKLNRANVCLEPGQSFSLKENTPGGYSKDISWYIQWKNGLTNKWDKTWIKIYGTYKNSNCYVTQKSINTVNVQFKKGTRQNGIFRIKVRENSSKKTAVCNFTLKNRPDVWCSNERNAVKVFWHNTLNYTNTYRIFRVDYKIKDLPKDYNARQKILKSTNKKWKIVGSIKINPNSFYGSYTDKNVKSGYCYCYTVRCLKNGKHYKDYDKVGCSIYHAG